MTDSYLINEETAMGIYLAIDEKYRQATGSSVGSLGGDGFADAITNLPTSSGGDPVQSLSISISEGAQALGYDISNIKILTSAEYATEIKSSTTLYIIVGSTS